MGESETEIKRWAAKRKTKVVVGVKGIGNDTEATFPSRVAGTFTVQQWPPPFGQPGSFLRAASKASHARCRSLARSEF